MAGGEPMTGQDDLEKESQRLEDVFFAKENAMLLAELRQKSGEEQRKKMLREVVKIGDEAFLTRLLTLGFQAQTAMTIAMIPLVFVAWADGKVDERERNAILAAARERGLTAEHISRGVLESALAHKPDPRLLALWKAYVTRLWGRFTANERWLMRKNLLGSAREVAEAAGGFLGLTSAISPEERRVLEEFEKLLD